MVDWQSYCLYSNHVEEATLDDLVCKILVSLEDGSIINSYQDRRGNLFSSKKGAVAFVIESGAEPNRFALMYIVNSECETKYFIKNLKTGRLLDILETEEKSRGHANYFNQILEREHPQGKLLLNIYNKMAPPTDYSIPIINEFSHGKQEQKKGVYSVRLADDLEVKLSLSEGKVGLEFVMLCAGCTIIKLVPEGERRFYKKILVDGQVVDACDEEIKAHRTSFENSLDNHPRYFGSLLKKVYDKGMSPRMYFHVLKEFEGVQSKK